MKQHNQKPKGFTLVELLVVIVIIGILATGSVAMFTGAQQKARDSVRITDIQAVKLALEQAYGDAASYPTPDNSAAGLQVLLDNGYIDQIPEDPKTGQKAGTGGCLVYMYAAADDEKTNVEAQEFELSTMFENSGNQTSKSAQDSGLDPIRWETGINTDHVDSTIVAGTTCAALDITLGVNKFKATDDTSAFVLDTM